MLCAVQANGLAWTAQNFAFINTGNRTFSPMYSGAEEIASSYTRSKAAVIADLNGDGLNGM